MYKIVAPVRARLGSNFGTSIMTFDIDIPFGICDIHGQLFDFSGSKDVYWNIQVLGTSEMQG